MAISVSLQVLRIEHSVCSEGTDKCNNEKGTFRDNAKGTFCSSVTNTMPVSKYCICQNIKVKPDNLMKNNEFRCGTIQETESLVRRVASTETNLHV